MKQGITIRDWLKREGSVFLRMKSGVKNRGGWIIERESGAGENKTARIP